MIEVAFLPLKDPLSLKSQWVDFSSFKQPEGSRLKVLAKIGLLKLFLFREVAHLLNLLRCYRVDSNMTQGIYNQLLDIVDINDFPIVE